MKPIPKYVSKPTSESFRERLGWGSRWLVRKRLVVPLIGIVRTTSENLIADGRPDRSAPPIYMKFRFYSTDFFSEISNLQNSLSRIFISWNWSEVWVSIRTPKPNSNPRARSNRRGLIGNALLRELWLRMTRFCLHNYLSMRHFLSKFYLRFVSLP